MIRRPAATSPQELIRKQRMQATGGLQPRCPDHRPGPGRSLAVLTADHAFDAYDIEVRRP